MRPAHLPLVLCLLLCLAVSLLCIGAAPILFHADASHYLNLGRSLSRGLGYHSGQLVFPDLMQPPLYPALVAALSGLLGGTLRAAVAVCVLCQLLSVVLLYASHGLLWGRRDRWVSALLGAVSANLAFGAALLLEPLFVLTQAMALYCLLRALVPPRRPGGPEGGPDGGPEDAKEAGPLARWVLAAGVCLGLGLLCRPEVVLTGAVFFGLCLLWPARAARRALLCAALVVGGLGCALPYGLWMKRQLGFFEVLPKVRYNVPFADINAHMDWEPDEEKLGTREQRTFFTLMPDRQDFVMNYAFAHPGFDPKAHFPRRQAEGRRGELREILWSVREVVQDALFSTAAFHPLALVLLALGALRGLRPWGPRGTASEPAPDEGPPPREQRLLTAALLLAVGLNLGPAMVSGIDYFARYLAGSVLFSVPLIAGGVRPAVALLRRRVPGRAAVALVVAPVALLHLLGTLAAARASVSRPALRERMALTEKLCAEALPAGARLLGEHPRYAFLRDAAFFQLPYSRSLEELEGYIAAHRIDWALLDSAALRRNPSRINRQLADPARWPKGWRVERQIDQDGQPLWLVRVR